MGGLSFETDYQGKAKELGPEMCKTMMKYDLEMSPEVKNTIELDPGKLGEALEAIGFDTEKGLDKFLPQELEQIIEAVSNVLTKAEFTPEPELEPAAPQPKSPEPDLHEEDEAEHFFSPQRIALPNPKPGDTTVDEKEEKEDLYKYAMDNVCPDKNDAAKVLATYLVMDALKKSGRDIEAGLKSDDPQVKRKAMADVKKLTDLVNKPEFVKGLLEKANISEKPDDKGMYAFSLDGKEPEDTPLLDPSDVNIDELDDPQPDDPQPDDLQPDDPQPDTCLVVNWLAPISLILLSLLLGRMKFMKITRRERNKLI